ncbi:deoxyribodipyrimidine photo-lyase [Jeotgalibacillus sp. R-1-5s-1]|uniref:FAD-binding domain-containing protein n=1 Tax=Jeotgalibacillus sp. R-1-5s-1 TaxID=2555897 RepID=UPI00106AA1FA|nr:deoxyribodipyrimidine photo-lyase [Jeotgalibacillus sp. R-1-5s-1]TFE00811.1 deoxyribodipyrimidine photo-lyase [Jeotgalibacillus sp. R-1-5s-1]
MVNVVWLKRDLRLHDHAALSNALESGEQIVLMYVAEPSVWQGTELSSRHFQFVKESLADLEEQVIQKGGYLTYAIGEMEEVLASCLKAFGPFTLYAHEEHGTPHTFARDLRVHKWMKKRGLVFNEYPQFGVVRRLKSREQFQEKWESFMSAPVHPIPPSINCVEQEHLPEALTPDLKSLNSFETGDDLPAASQKGGERTGIEVFKDFLNGRYQRYQFQISKPMASAVSCSRISPYLAWGNLSMRAVVQKTRKVMALLDSDQQHQHLEYFMSRLHWHCHFIQRLEDDPEIAIQTMNPAFDQVRSEWNEEWFTAWKNGHTGVPMIDAAMRALLETGWVNFRSRAMLVSFICNTLLQDWRQPAEHLAQLFTDYEPGIHYSQVQMQSASTGFNTIRIYHPVKQGFDHDPKGAFIRRFIPELRGVPNEYIHEPWKWDRFDELDYPAPIVNVDEANRYARAVLWGVKNSAESKKTAAEKLKKHGSRRDRKASSEQLSLSLFDGEEE